MIFFFTFIMFLGILNKHKAFFILFFMFYVSKPLFSFPSYLLEIAKWVNLPNPVPQSLDSPSKCRNRLWGDRTLVGASAWWRSWRTGRSILRIEWWCLLWRGLSSIRKLICFIGSRSVDTSLLFSHYWQSFVCGRNRSV
jgi:hypothetical protein